MAKGDSNRGDRGESNRGGASKQTAANLNRGMGGSKIDMQEKGSLSQQNRGGTARQRGGTKRLAQDDKAGGMGASVSKRVVRGSVARGGKQGGGGAGQGGGGGGGGKASRGTTRREAPHSPAHSEPWEAPESGTVRPADEGGRRERTPKGEAL